MALKINLKSRTLWLVLACPVLAAVLLLLAPYLLERQEMAIFDIYQSTVTPPPVKEKFVLILARERSLRELQNWPWPRRVHARLLSRLGASKLVVLDAIFPQDSTPEDDRLLAEACQTAGNVIGAGLMSLNETTNATELILPYKAMSTALLDIGMVNVDPDADGIARNYRLLWSFGDSFVPSLPMTVIQHAGREVAVVGEDSTGYDVRLASGREEAAAGGGLAGKGAEESPKRVRTGLDFTFKIHHPKKDPPIYEYIDVLDGLVAPEVFQGAIVIVGVNAGGATDYFPIGRGRIIPGSLYVAHATMTLLHGWIPFEAARLWLVLAAFMTALAGAALGAMGPITSRRMITHWAIWLGATVVLWLALDYALFAIFKVWLPPLRPTLGALASFGLVLAVRSRPMTAEWQIQRLSIESVLFLGRLDFSAEMTDFQDYITKNWPEIERWSGISLISASVSADDAEVQAALKRLPESGSGEAVDILEASILYAKSGINRLLLGLPDMETRVSQYTVLGWAGRRSPETLKSVAALVLTAAMHFKALEEYRGRRELFTGLIKMIIGAMDAKDPTTAGHSNRVAELSKELAEKLGLSPEEVDNIYLGGLLHDVGKLGIPDDILNKPGRLDDREMDVIRRHPAIGGELMRQIKLPDIIMQSIFEHHERLDGKGYPNNIDGRQLSLAGRILKIADVFDALISKRQYKDPVPMPQVYDIIKEGMGTEFDAELVKIILEHPFVGPGLEFPALITLGPNGELVSAPLELPKEKLEELSAPATTDSPASADSLAGASAKALDQAPEAVSPENRGK